MDWPDWRGRAVAIIASGPSVKKDEVALLKGRLPVLAIKRNVELAPWADVVYGCDAAWWRSVRGLPEFPGLKIAYEAAVAKDYGLRKIDILRVTDARGGFPGGYSPIADRIVTETIGTVGSGGNSGFQALNLAVQWGATDILLVGFDCQDRSGAHWYGRNVTQGMSNPGPINFQRWIPAFKAAAQQLRDMGIDVVNASPISAVKGFRRAGVAETLEAWGL